MARAELHAAKLMIDFSSLDYLLGEIIDSTDTTDSALTSDQHFRDAFAIALPEIESVRRRLLILAGALQRLEYKINE